MVRKTDRQAVESKTIGQRRHPSAPDPTDAAPGKEPLRPSLSQLPAVFPLTVAQQTLKVGEPLRSRASERTNIPTMRSWHRINSRFQPDNRFSTAHVEKHPELLQTTSIYNCSTSRRSLELARRFCGTGPSFYGSETTMAAVIRSAMDW